MRIECPSGLIIEARKPQGSELKTLARATEARDPGTGIAEVLRSCWVSTEDPGPYPFAAGGAFDWKKVLAGDVMVTMLHLRMSVLGNLYEFHVGCEHCGAKNELEADLSQVELKPLPPTTFEAMRGNRPLEAKTIDGRVVRFRPGTLAHQDYLRDQLKQMKRRPEWAGHTPSMVDGLAAPIVFVDGLTSSKGEDVSNEFVKRLQWLLKADVDVIYDLRQQMLDADCGVDTGIEFTCTECHWEQKRDFPLGSAFFGPSKPKPKRVEATGETLMATTESPGPTT